MYLYCQKSLVTLIKQHQRPAPGFIQSKKTEQGYGPLFPRTNNFLYELVLEECNKCALCFSLYFAMPQISFIKFYLFETRVTVFAGISYPRPTHACPTQTDFQPTKYIENVWKIKLNISIICEINVSLSKFLSSPDLN